jgi:hypothetical protein
LIFIQKNLGFGTVNSRFKKPVARFGVTKLEEIAIIVAIFYKNNLNTNKHFNFLTFAKAYRLYTEINSREVRKNLKPLLDKLILTMNNKRTDFDLPPSHKIKITTNWLLGFVEGEGCFFYNKLKGTLGFQISQKGNADLMIAIRTFIYKLGKEKFDTGVNLNLEQNVWYLRVMREDLIKEVLIPFFSSLNFHTKKFLDFQDWVAISKIREKGLHSLPEGKELIDRITSQMNNYRFSTSGKLSSEIPKIDRATLRADIANLLARPSNYERGSDGRIFDIYLGRYISSGGRTGKKVQILYPNGETAKIFNTGSACARFLGLSEATFRRRLYNNKSVMFNNQECQIKRIALDSD